MDEIVTDISSITIDNVEVYGFEAAIRGMRNPLNSWDRSDSDFELVNDGVPAIGENDIKLMSNLARSGPDHGKLLRFIHVSMDITAPTYWWIEFDTYKVGTVANSCSKMHTIHKRPIDISDFQTMNMTDEYNDALSRAIDAFNELRTMFIEYEQTEDGSDWYSKEQIFRSMVSILPMGFKQKRTVDLNYQVLRSMYHARKNHKLIEWRDFCDFIEDSIPYADSLISC